MLLLFAMAACWPSVLIGDENWYLQDAARLNREGPSLDWLLEMKGPAGPTYAVFHAGLHPLTGFTKAGVRVTNVVVLAIVVWLWELVARRLRPDLPKGIGAICFAVPMVWVIGGMALTEMPALLFASVSMAVLTQSEAGQLALPGKAWLTGTLAGALFGISILGRQPLVLGVIGAAGAGALTRQFGRWGGFAAACLIIVVPVFLIWGGPVPPGMKAVGIGLAPKHAILAFGYAGMVLLIVSPAQLLSRKWGEWAIAAAAGLLAAATDWFRQLPLAVVFQALFNPVLVGWLERGCAALIVTLAVIFLISLTTSLWQNRDRSLVLFSGILAFLVLASCAKVTHIFSSRYVGSVFPFLLWAYLPGLRANRWFTVRCFLGALLGFCALASYHHVHTPH